MARAICACAMVLITRSEWSLDSPIYVRGAFSSNACPAYTDIVMDENECKDAAAAIGGRYMRAGTWPNYPGGCYCNPLDGNVWLNTDVSSGSAHLNYRKLCRKDATRSNCDFVSDKLQYVNVSDIDAGGPLYVAQAPLPEKAWGVFWSVDDGGDALISFGSPLGGDDSVECNNGKLTEDDSASSIGRYCTTISLTRPGGWTFQAVGTPRAFGGTFPTAADSLYKTCGMKWKFCFDSNEDPLNFEAIPIATRGLPCVNVFAMTTTAGAYKGMKDGGHYWRITTKVGPVPLPSFIPGNFDMIQVMDGNGSKIQPAWDNFQKRNQQIVYYTGETESWEGVGIIA